MIRSVFMTILLSCSVSACAPVISAVNKDGVQEDPSRRSVGTVIDDQSIETVVKVNLNAADEQLKKAHLSVISHNGIVLLVGQVPSQEIKNVATRVVASANRVRTVHNELEVTPATSFLTRSHDSWITAKIKTKMLAHNEISARRTNVTTENGVVYLMGLVTREESDQIADMASTTRGAIKVVKVFEYIN